MSRLRDVHGYLDSRRALRAARAALRRDGDIAAAEAMWRLNRAAKRRPHIRGSTYGMKNRLIRILYERHGAVVRLQIQTQRCWGDWGYGCGPECSRCGGTGIYKRHRLLLFTFEIGGRRYSWHQPERLVDWPVTVEPGEGTFGDTAPAGEGDPFAGGEDMRIAQATLWRFLRDAGVPRSDLPPIPRLWGSVRGDIRTWWVNLRPVIATKRRWWQLKEALRRGWALLTPEVPPGAAVAGRWEPDYEDGDDDLPF